MTGWGQDGPLAQTAGHDIEYIAITGALLRDRPGPAPPHFPANLVGDFGGGSTYLVIGDPRRPPRGPPQRSGSGRRRRDRRRTAHLNTMAAGFLAGGNVGSSRGQPARHRRAVLRPLRDRQRRHISVGALEPQFYEVLVGPGLQDAPGPLRPGQLRGARRIIAEALAPAPRPSAEVFEGTDACVAPIFRSARRWSTHTWPRARCSWSRRRSPAGTCPALFPYALQPLLHRGRGPGRHPGSPRRLGHQGRRLADREGCRRPGMTTPSRFSAGGSVERIAEDWPGRVVPAFVTSASRDRQAGGEPAPGDGQWPSAAPRLRRSVGAASGGRATATSDRGVSRDRCDRVVDR